MMLQPGPHGSATIGVTIRICIESNRVDWQPRASRAWSVCRELCARESRYTTSDPGGLFGAIGARYTTCRHGVLWQIPLGVMMMGQATQKEGECRKVCRVVF